ncbi:MAG: hypothetical protein HKO56_08980, partial [Bacteroidia bacterium]|nr:hypothetical protein [Bacteroidia bacterium]
IGNLGVTQVETMTFDQSCNTLYTANNADFGTINITNGSFSSLGQLGVVSNPTLGNHTLGDIDGMAIDNQSGFIYASERISTGSDLLFLIDPSTGMVVQNAFGPNTDYVQITGTDQDIDDLAFNPCTHELYGLTNVSNNDVLVTIDLLTGVATEILTLSSCDGEGMSFYNDCELYISIGGSGCNGNGKIYHVNLTTGALSEVTTIGGDVEALVCCTSIPQPPVLSCSVVQTKEICESGGAELYVEGNGGSGGYSYIWSTGSTNQTVGNLAAGTYSITVTDSSNTTSTCQYTVTTSFSCSTSIVNDVQCYGASDGSASVSISGENASISISDINDEIWIEAECGTVGSNWNIINDNTTSNDEYAIWTGADSYTVPPTDTDDIMTYTFDVGSAGTYQLWGLVNAPNSGDDSFWIQVDNNTWVRWNLLPGAGAWTWDDLHDDRNGSIAISYYLVEGHHSLTIAYRESGAAIDKLLFTPNGNTPSGFGNVDNACIPVSYSYLWDNSETDSIAIALNAGLHNVTVTDSNGCTTTCSVTINEPSELTCSIVEDNPVVCNGESNGVATVTPAGGNGGFTYLWDNAETTQQATALSAGVHTVTVTDLEGCTSSCSATINEPSELTCSIVEDNPVACNGESNGVATVTPVGGNGGFTFLWDNAETTQQATALSAGVHTVTVTDSEGCTSSCS